MLQIQIHERIMLATVKVFGTAAVNMGCTFALYRKIGDDPLMALWIVVYQGLGQDD